MCKMAACNKKGGKCAVVGFVDDMLRYSPISTYECVVDYPGERVELNVRHDN